MPKYKRYTLPLIPLKGLTIFPNMILHFDVGRSKTICALEESMAKDQMVFLTLQEDVINNEAGKEHFRTIGTISSIKQILKLPDGNLRVLVEGISRGKITKYLSDDPFFMVNVVEKEDVKADDNLETEVLMRKIHHLFENYLEMYNRLTPETLSAIMSINNPGELADIMTANLPLKPQDKQIILEELNVRQRLEKLIVIMYRELEILELENDIHSKVKGEINERQREYYMREQLKVLQSELGEADGNSAEINEYRKTAEEKKLPEFVMEKLEKEFHKMSKMQSGHPEGSVIRNYIETVLELPWTVSTKESINIKNAQTILEKDHYGLEKIKERILEYLAVKSLTNNNYASILCFVGPPGTGKTSIAKSLASALNKNYVRISLGGVHDESEIRGHRKTYIGSMPGRVITALKQAQSNNPLILFDEIDKMASDFRGDPASAMLEVLDSEQNYAFRDHFLELPFDLSKTMFVTTANTVSTIPKPLLDRMEIIEVTGYTEDEKLNIAKKYLFPKQRKLHGLTAKNLKTTDTIIKEIITGYTKESGVRGLERTIAKLCRKVAKEIVDEKKESITLSSAIVQKHLGCKKYIYSTINADDQTGIATGLAWTAAGGDTLFVEVNTMPGTGKLELTGQLGDVMKESARAALSFIRANCLKLGINCDFYKTLDIHIHVPEGAIPKDGPSAGITMATALISALSDTPIKREVAMTGEITLRGRVLPIGGLKEKALAAYRAGIKTIIIPYENKKDYDELPAKIRNEINFIPAKDMDTVLKIALTHSPNKTEALSKNINFIEYTSKNDSITPS